MLVIFLLSAQRADDSSALSGSILKVVASTLDAGVRALGGVGLSSQALGLLHVVVRKTAHFVAYLVLAGLTARAVLVSQRDGAGAVARSTGGAVAPSTGGAVAPTTADAVAPTTADAQSVWWRTAPVAWLIATAYAATDEVHQLFVPGRGGQVTDVLLDSAGALLGVWLYLAWVRRSTGGMDRRPTARMDSGV